ncbi:hypothetical protein AALO_G00148230 [Alosa alosa]|uniref:Uncharacterized protein n=1 Tax=Alosa alosa TaxID=278164 RepID=A0AAV6GGM6_9TELE|nr:hypothetical protein AALO_G00148230 [Alosa alosa]
MSFLEGSFRSIYLARAHAYWVALKGTKKGFGGLETLMTFTGAITFPVPSRAFQYLFEMPMRV